MCKSGSHFFCKFRSSLKRQARPQKETCHVESGPALQGAYKNFLNQKMTLIFSILPYYLPFSPHPLTIILSLPISLNLSLLLILSLYSPLFLPSLPKIFSLKYICVPISLSLSLLHSPVIISI